jgi:hypothetical protein
MGIGSGLMGFSNDLIGLMGFSGDLTGLNGDLVMIQKGCLWDLVMVS